MGNNIKGYSISGSILGSGGYIRILRDLGFVGLPKLNGKGAQ